jgi:undecaprenyl-diphosphatase
VNWLGAALLGVVQGLTEFLPVSSSAHLILGRTLFGWDAARLGLAFDVACHVGTLCAVVAYFWRDLWNMAAAAGRLFADDPDARRARLIVAGTLPVVLVGLTLADVIETQLRTPAVCAVTLAVGAIGLIVAERLGSRTRSERDIGYGMALALGVAQASALVPGVSRSGATITVGMLMGLGRPDAARFSFLLGVPAIVAAAAKEGLDLAEIGLGAGDGGLFAVGMLTSAVVGYLTIKYFLRFLTTHRLDVFAYYRLVLSAVLIVWLGTAR